MYIYLESYDNIKDWYLGELVLTVAPAVVPADPAVPLAVLLLLPLLVVLSSGGSFSFASNACQYETNYIKYENTL